MTIQSDPERNEIRFLHKFADFAASRKRVLEIGCGEGRLTWQYAKETHSTIAIDLDADALRVATIDRPSDLESKVHFVSAKSEQLPFSKEMFDMAILAWSFGGIEHEGMVHALDEIRRVLVNGGIMIDMRPILDRWPIEVVSARSIHGTGHIQDLPPGIADDEAANQSMAQAEQDGWFIRQAEDFFPFVYSWDTPSEMEEWILTEWHDFIRLDEDTRQATRSAWASADADARVQVKVKMLITRWRVVAQTSKP